MVKMESEHSIDGPTGREFPQSVIISEIWWHEVTSR